MRLNWGKVFVLQIQRAAVFAVLCALLAGVASAKEKNPSTAPISAALCQVVYPLDQSPEDGYRYIFLGNGFFINNGGYLVTAAHLLSDFRYGGIPYVLVGPSEGPRRMIEAPIVAADWAHDVALLRAAPNPFQADRQVAFLRLSTATLAPGDDVMAASLIPPDEKNARSLVAPAEDVSQGEVIDYQFYSEQGEAERQLLLFNRQVVPGQSGSPLVSAETHAVVGVIVGSWLHPTVAPSGPGGGQVTVSPGAALRIHYAIGLLEQMHVPWDMVSESPQQPETPSQQTSGFTPPAPLSVVGTAYPPQALYGGEVVLDALVDADGKLADVRVIAGDSPFVDAALNAVHTWTFSPARLDGRPTESRIGIVFQFPQSFLPRITQKQHKYEEPEPKATDRAALPVLAVQPDYPANSVGEGSVILEGLVDAEGHLTSTSILRDLESLAGPTKQAMQQWQFVPGERDGKAVESEVVVVETFRRPTLR
jgi:TonB family protein